LAVDEHGHRSVIDQLDVHHRLESAGRHWHTSCLQFSHDCLVQRPRRLRRRRLVERRPSSLAHVAVERELRDDQHAASGVHDGAIHGLAGVGLEHAHVADLGGDIARVRLGVRLADAEQDEQSGADLSNHLIVDAHARRRDALDHCAHG
jgi:hypothetical protein